MKRYFVRWRTEPRRGGIPGIFVVGWDVCDFDKFDKLEVASFGPNEKEQADAICKLLNSNEEIDYGVSK